MFHSATVPVLLVVIVAVATKTTACPFLESRNGENHCLHAVGDADVPEEHNAVVDFEKRPRRKLQSVEDAIESLRDEVSSLIARRRSMGPKLVRLGFHDCVGGCDGCVDLNNPSHAGLEFPMRQMRRLCQDHAEFLTRADCWAIASLRAAELAQPEAQAIAYNYRYHGRETCNGANAIGNGGPTHPTMPGPHLTTKGLLDYFATEFGYSTNETVAIMGAHTLGRMFNDNSGFDGPWVPGLTTLNNGFYIFLMDTTRPNMPSSDYAQVSDRNSNSNFTWARLAPDGSGDLGPMVMLNADMAVVVDLEDHMINQDSGEVDCILLLAASGEDSDNGRPHCPKAAQTFEKAEEYARNSDLWLVDFRNVFEKMTIQGHTIPQFCRDNPNQLCDVSTS